MSGSVTVEAAMVMPIVIFISIALIMEILFLYDCIHLQAGVREAVLFAKQMQDSGQRISEDGIEYTTLNNETLFDKYFSRKDYSESSLYTDICNTAQTIVAELTDVKTEITGTHIKVTMLVTAYKNIPVPIVRLLPDRLFYKELEVITTINNPCELTRRATVILDFGEKIESVENILQKVSGFLKDIR